MAIQLFVPTFRIDECLDEIKECLEKGWTGIGYKTVEFEEKWKAYTGLNNAHFLNSDTAALHLFPSIWPHPPWYTYRLLPAFSHSPSPHARNL